MTRPDTVVLDLDGTLVDSVYVHALAWKEAFREVGVDIPTYRLHRAVGMGGDRLVAAVAGAATEEAVGDVIRKLHDDLFRLRRPEVHVLDGAAELLVACRDAGLRQVVASSSKPEDTEALLALVEGSRMIGDGRVRRRGPEQARPRPRRAGPGHGPVPLTPSWSATRCGTSSPRPARASRAWAC